MGNLFKMFLTGLMQLIGVTVLFASTAMILNYNGMSYQGSVNYGAVVCCIYVIVVFWRKMLPLPLRKRGQK